MDVNEALENQKREQSEQQKNSVPPEATSLSSSEPGPRKSRPPRRGIEGSKRLLCKRCGHFLAEVKYTQTCEVLVLCQKCKCENIFAFQELS